MTKTAFIFPGQGSQKVGMAKDVYDNFSYVKDLFDEANDILSVDLAKITFEGPIEELTKTQHTQPALMVTSIALLKVMQNEFGINVSDNSQYVAGHSLGEYSALCAAEAVSFSEAVRLLGIRGSQMAQCASKTKGAMAAIIGSDNVTVEGIVKEAAANDICQLANDNSVGQIVISGSKDAVDRAISIAKEKGIKRAIPLPVSGAFHSQLMADASSAMAEALETAKIKKPIVPVIANVTAKATDDDQQIKELLTKQVTGCVRWRESLIELEDLGVTKLVEIGAGKVLCGLAGRTIKNVEAVSIQGLEDIKTFTT